MILMGEVFCMGFLYPLCVGLHGLYRVGRQNIGGKVCWFMQTKHELES